MIEISGPLDDSGARRILRALRAAESTTPELVVFSFDSPGGSVSASLEVADGINAMRVPTACLVRDGVAGTVFLIAAVDHIYFAPDGVCGSAAPVVVRDDDVEATGVMRKLIAYTNAEVRGWTEANGHDPAIFAAMMDPDTELVRDGKVWKAKGELLALTASEAGALGLSRGTVASVDDVIARQRATPGRAPAQND